MQTFRLRNTGSLFRERTLYFGNINHLHLEGGVEIQVVWNLINHLMSEDDSPLFFCPISLPGQLAVEIWYAADLLVSKGRFEISFHNEWDSISVGVLKKILQHKLLERTGTAYDISATFIEGDKKWVLTKTSM